MMGPAPLSMGFSRQEYWSGLPCPSPGELPNPGMEPASLMASVLAGRLLTTSATCCFCCLVAKSYPTLRPYGLQPARLLCPWDSPDKNTGMGCHALLQGNFPTQGWNLSLLHLLYSGGFFTICLTWEASCTIIHYLTIQEIKFIIPIL